MPPPDTSDAPPRDMFTPSQIRALKFAVIGMGAILLLGFALVIGRIIYLVNSEPRPSAPAKASSGTASLTPPSPLDLPSGAVVRHMAISPGHLAVHFEAPSGAGLRILDLATGTWSPVIAVRPGAMPSSPTR